MGIMDEEELAMRMEEMEVDEEEEEEDEEEDESDDEDLKQVQALPVNGAPLPPTDNPENADEYLRMVRFEAMRLPDVAKADIVEKTSRRRPCGYTAKMAALGDVPSSSLAPSKEWTQ